MISMLRAGDADREQVVTTLREHTAADRLSLDEFSDRARAAYAARTVADLAALTSDLPPDSPTGQRPSHGAAATVMWIVAAVAVVVLLLGLVALHLSAMTTHMGNMPH